MKVIITGMHRSGTSLIAGLLRLCGLEMGKDFISADPGNPRGYWEDRTFLALNKEILAINGGDWRSPPNEISYRDLRVIQKMKDFTAKWPMDKTVGWKDPRACLTFDLWRKVIEPEELRIILVLRPIDEIAKSLQKRNGFSIERGQDLATVYMKNAMCNTDHLKWRVTLYHNYFKNWQTELNEICDFMGLKIPKDTTKIQAFIDPKLCHYGRR